MFLLGFSVAIEIEVGNAPSVAFGFSPWDCAMVLTLPCQKNFHNEELLRIINAQRFCLGVSILICHRTSSYHVVLSFNLLFYRIFHFLLFLRSLFFHDNSFESRASSNKKTGNGQMVEGSKGR
jgi:hypothetical protein